MPRMRRYKPKWGMKMLNPMEILPAFYFVVDNITTEKQGGASFKQVLFQMFGKCSRRWMVTNIFQIAEIITFSCCCVLLN